MDGWGGAWTVTRTHEGYGDEGRIIVVHRTKGAGEWEPL